MGDATETRPARGAAADGAPASTAATLAAVDWGTSGFRLWLVDGGGRVLAERRSREGMTAAGRAGFPAVLGAHLAAVGAGPDLPVVICGMAGARQGWVEAGYLDAPARLADVPGRAVRVPGQARDVRILPGIAQRDAGAPDVMRGEETQLLGALGAGAGEATACLPGTHAKWVALRDGTVRHFSTYMTGELFEAATRATLLAHAVAGAAEAVEARAFRAAVAAAHAEPARAANLLFRVRGGQLLFGGDPAAARERISGTLIGLELAGALADGPPGAVTLIASGRLRDLYALALEAVAVPARVVDADAAALAGLRAAAAALWPR